MTCDSFARASTPRTTSAFAPRGTVCEAAGTARASTPATAMRARIMPLPSLLERASEGQAPARPLVLHAYKFMLIVVQHYRPTITHIQLSLYIPGQYFGIPSRDVTRHV